MSATVTSVVVYPEVMFNTGGIVRRWADSVMISYTDKARSAAPVNSRPNKGSSPYPVGALAASISGEVNRIGPEALDTRISVNVPYALYVIKGTGNIYSRSARIPAGQAGGGQFTMLGEGSGMWLPGNPGYGRGRYVQRVSGQTANNFLARAGREMGAAHPALRGFNTI